MLSLITVFALIPAEVGDGTGGWRELNEVHHLSCVCTAQSSDTVVKLCEAASKASDSKLSFRLRKPYMCIVSPELWELEGYSMYTDSI